MTEPAPLPRSRTTLVVASLGFFLITLDILIVNLALTDLHRDLGASVTDQQWVVDGYTLPFAALLLFGGNLSDRIGARRSYAIGVVAFLVTSIGCALSPSIGVLIAARFLQGASAAVMLPASMALVREAFPGSRSRAHALGIWAVGGAVAGTLGPLLGGVLATIDWRLVFAINVPVTTTMAILLLRVARSPRRPRPFDVAGQLLGAMGLAALITGLLEGGAVGYGTPWVIALLVAAVLALAAFIVVESRAPHPLIPLTIFHDPRMGIASGTGFAFMVSHFGSVFVLSLHLQQQLGLSPLLAGIVFFPSSVLAIAGNALSGRIANRFGPRVPIVLGLASMVLGLMLQILTLPLESPALIGVFLVLTGVGGSVAMPQATAVVLDAVAPELAGTASAVFNTFRQIGGAVAIAVFGAILASSLPATGAAQVCFVIAAMLLTAMAVLSTRIRRA